MDPVHSLDLEHGGLPGAITAWLVVDPEPTLVDPGPSTTLETLEARLAERGVGLRELRRLCLTHVHLDHAGAAGHLAHRIPGLTVHVHEDGAPHLADPARLVASTRRTFGEAHDRLWGEVLPVPRSRLRGWRPGDRSPRTALRALHTPGHIGHHVAWLHEASGTLLSGDAAGIVLSGDGPTHPPTPPPTVDLVAWARTRSELAAVGPERVGVAHAGLHDRPGARLRELGERLDALEARVEAALDAGREEEDARAYEEEVRAEHARHLPRERVDGYFDTFRAETDYRGVVRYVRKRREG